MPWRDGRSLLAAGNVPAGTPRVNVHTVVQAVHVLRWCLPARVLSAVVPEPRRFVLLDARIRGRPEADIIARHALPGSEPRRYTAFRQG